MARYETDGVTKIVEKSNPNEDMMRGAFIAAMLIPREKKSKDPTRKSHNEGEARLMPLTHSQRAYVDDCYSGPVARFFGKIIWGLRCTVVYGGSTAAVLGLVYVGLMLAGYVH